MYLFVDRHVSLLANDGRFLLWAMRTWAAAVARRTCAPQALLPGFSALGASMALPTFHMVSALINQHARDQLGMAPIACHTIAEHEAVLLSIWQDLALARFEFADVTIGLLVAESAASQVRHAFAAASAQFIMAGLDHSQMMLEQSEAPK
jgi:hypothetical protein